jgi:hypothetical protein
MTDIVREVPRADAALTDRLPATAKCRARVNSLHAVPFASGQPVTFFPVSDVSSAYKSVKVVRLDGHECQGVRHGRT